MPFLGFITRSRYHAMGVASLSLLVPGFGLFFSLAIIALATLLHGVKEGIGVGVGTVFLTVLWLWFFSQALVTFHLPWHLSLIFMVVVACGALRSGISWGNLLAAFVTLAAIGIAIVHIQLPDSAEYRNQALFGDLPSMELPEIGTPEGAGTSEAPIDPDADNAVMPIDLRSLPLIGIFMTTIVILLLLTMCMARYAQAALVNPGGFGREFRTLDLGRRFTTGTLVLLSVAVVLSSDPESGIFWDLFILASSIYIVQGIALAHALAKTYRLQGTWLFLMYAGIFLGPFLLPGLALLVHMGLLLAGISDTWIDYRARLARKA